MWQEKRTKWQAVLLSVPAAFQAIPQTQLWVHAFNKRQAVMQEHESLSRTGMQSSLEIAQYETLMETASGKKLSPAQLSVELVKHGLQETVGGKKKNEDEDPGSLSANYIANALAVHKSVLSSSVNVEVLMELESLFGSQSPFHQLSKLAVMASKPASARTREWVLQAVADSVVHGGAKPQDITKGTLSGDKHHVGLVQLYEMKLKACWIYHTDSTSLHYLCNFSFFDVYTQRTHAYRHYCRRIHEHALIVILYFQINVY